MVGELRRIPMMDLRAVEPDLPHTRRRDADQLGFNPFVLQPGEPMSLYHREADQEAFLVVSGEALLIVEGQGSLSHPLRAQEAEVAGGADGEPDLGERGA